jgi:ABC-type multidrug transport system permease subunit
MTTTTKVRSRDGLFALLSFAGGLIAGWVDFNNDEPQAAAIVVILCAALLGFAQPRNAWRWAIVIALGIPVVYLIATTLGLQPRTPPEPGLYASLLALIPSFISAYGGVLIRKVISSA